MPISEQALQDVFNLAVHAKHHQGRKKDLRLCFAELEHLTLAQGDDKFSACEGLLNFSQIKAVFISNVCGYTYDEIMNILFSLLIRSGKILEAKFSAEEVVKLLMRMKVAHIMLQDKTMFYQIHNSLIERAGTSLSDSDELMTKLISFNQRYLQYLGPKLQQNPFFYYQLLKQKKMLICDLPDVMRHNPELLGLFIQEHDDYLREIQQLALADLLLGFDVALGFMLLHLPLLAGISVLISLIYLGQIVELYLKSEARTNAMIIK